jgi:hypothetical protein
MLCRQCNNALTKPFDKAYAEFSKWVFVASKTLHEQDAIDFAEVFGNSYPEKCLDLLRYFGKSFGCRLVDVGIKPPEGLRQILVEKNRNDSKPLLVTFGINHFWRRIDPKGRILGDDCPVSWFDATGRQSFSWIATLVPRVIHITG